MTTTHSRHRPLPPRHRGRRTVDLASLALLIVGLSFGVLAYVLITRNGASPLLLVPSVIAATLGGTHLTKRQAPRDR